MLINILSLIFRRDLAALIRELDAYPDDAAVWREVPGLPNTAGTLVLHLVGNLNHFIGAVLGETGYLRDRDAEFGRRDVPRAELRQAATETAAVVNQVLGFLSHERLAQPFPVRFGDTTLRTDTMLLHLAGHLAFHIGQIDYHRRVVTGDGRGVAAMVPTELAE